MWAGGGELQRARFSASWLNSLVLVKLGCSHAFMNEQEISRVIFKKTYLTNDHTSAAPVMQGNISS